jgi:CubicO group peptidase (beta-lactamase class C family)
MREKLLGLFAVILLCAAGIATSLPLGASQASSAGVEAPVCGSYAAVSAKLDDYMTALADAGQFSGAVLVAQNGTTILSKGYGMANYACSVPNTPQTVFRIASNTKQFTAAAIMKLQEQGRLNVTDPITKYIPDAPPQWKDIKIYELLNHTSGMPREGGYDVTDPTNIALPDLVHRFYTLPLDFEPGTNYSYSNNGYITLSYIIEQASGQSYDEYLYQNIFEPLGMNSTGGQEMSDIVPNLACGYTTEAGTLINYDLQNIHNVYGAGSLHSTTEDLYRWGQVFQTPGGVVSSASIGAMLEHGYGIGKATYDNRTLVSFTGRNFGYISQTIYFPDDNVTIVWLANYDRTYVANLTKDLIAITFGEPHSLPQRIDRQQTPLNATALQDYIGTYQAVGAPWNYTVFQDGNQLFYTSSVPKETVKLFHENNDTFFVTSESPDSFIFTRDNSGKVDGLNMTSGTGIDRAVKVS